MGYKKNDKTTNIEGIALKEPIANRGHRAAFPFFLWRQQKTYLVLQNRHVGNITANEKAGTNALEKLFNENGQKMKDCMVIIVCNMLINKTLIHT